MSWRLLMRRGFRYIPGIVEKAKKPGAWQTLGGALRYVGSVVGKPLAWGAGAMGLLTLTGIGIENIRHALMIRTPEEQAKEQAEAQRQMLENAERELRLYEKWLNLLRSQQIPGYQPYTIIPVPIPEWRLPSTKPSSAEAKPKKGFNWTILLPIAGIAIIIGVLLFRRK